MLFVLIAVLMAIFGVLLSLKGWAWMRNRAETLGSRVEQHSGVLFETAESEIDDFVNEASRYRPILVKMPLFFVGIFLSILMIFFDLKFGLSRGGVTFAGLTLALLFVAADLALPIVTLRSDKGTAKFWEFDKSDRDGISWGLIALCTVMSVFVVIGSTSELANTTGAATKISQTTYKNQIENIGRWKAERARLPDDRGHKALQALADSSSAAAERESKRRYCGSKCERLKKQAATFAARAADAKRKEDLTGKIALAEKNLQGMADVRTLDDPFATTVSDFTGGGVDKEAASRYSTTIFGLIAVIITTLVWLRVADQAGIIMHQEFKRRGAIGDAMRKEQGLPAKFATVEEAEAQALLPPPMETIVVNVAADDMRRRYANDPDLLVVDELFGSLLEPDENGVTATTALYAEYRAEQIKAGASKWMTPPTMAQKLNTIAKERDDVMLTADGRIKGWSLKSTQAVMEAAE